MPAPTGRTRGWRRSRRLALAMVLIAVATWAVVAEPLPEGAVLVALTPEHGIDVADLPAIGLYLVALGLIGSWMGGSRA